MLSIEDLATAEEVDTVLGQAISQAFVAESASRHRGPHDLGLSALGGCTRRAAHQLAGTPPSNEVPPEEGREANLGTWIHAGLLSRMAGQIDQAHDEVEVTLRVAGVRLKGHADLPAPGIVVDLKTAKEYRLQWVRKDGAPLAHMIQIAAYGVALIQAGTPVNWLSVIYLDRSSGEVEIVTTEFTNRLALLVIDRVALLRRHADAPDDAPQTDAGGSRMHGPDRGFQCKTCPWMKRCWGSDAEPGKWLPREYERPDIEALLLEYVEARAAESVAKGRKNEVAALLKGTHHGVYGPVRYGRNQDSLIDDGAAAIRILRDLEIPVPQTWRQGALNVRLVKATQNRKPKKK